MLYVLVGKTKNGKKKTCFAGRKNSNGKTENSILFFTKIVIKNEKTKQNKKTQMNIRELKKTRSNRLTSYQAEAKEKHIHVPTYAY